MEPPQAIVMEPATLGTLLSILKGKIIRSHEEKQTLEKTMNEQLPDLQKTLGFVVDNPKDVSYLAPRGCVIFAPSRCSSSRIYDVIEPVKEHLDEPTLQEMLDCDASFIVTKNVLGRCKTGTGDFVGFSFPKIMETMQQYHEEAWMAYEDRLRGAPGGECT